MKEKATIIIISLLILSIVISAYVCINTMVSVKYETEMDGCISKVDGRNLCEILKIAQITLFSSLILIFAIPIFKKGLNKNRN